MELKRILLSGLTVAMLVLPAHAVGEAPPDDPSTGARSGPISVGAFLVEMARMLDPSLPEGLTLEEAVARLEQAGLQMPADADYEAHLTQGDVVRFASSVGIRLKSLSPDELFPAANVGELAVILREGVQGSSSAVATVLGSGDPDRGDSAAERAKEKRKKKKTFESPSGN